MLRGGGRYYSPSAMFVFKGVEHDASVGDGTSVMLHFFPQMVTLVSFSENPDPTRVII